MSEETLGTIFRIGAGDAATVSAGTDTFSVLGEVTGSSGGGLAANAINDTDLASTYGTFLPGRPTGKPITMDIKVVRDDAGQVLAKAAIVGRILKNVQVEYSGGDIEDFQAVVTDFDPGQVGDDDIVRGSITFQISGAITLT